jgi:LCP family protein required for cell wall assembly
MLSGASGPVHASLFRMRTTLKRRIGRWGEPSGNGGAAPPPPLDTGPSFYEQPRSGGRIFRRIGRFLVDVTLTVAVLAGGFLGGTALWGKKEIEKTKPTSPDVLRAKQYTNVAVPNQPIIGLVVGYDHRRDTGGDPGRSDTLMLVRVDPRPGTKSITLLSFPRDLREPLYCNKNYSFATNKINDAYNRCGALGSLLTVKALTRIPINYVVKLNFRGFKQIVDKMNGVWIDVDRRYYVPPGAGYASINLQPGYQRLPGGPALDYSRYRHGDSDLFRIIRQQAFIHALRDQFSKLSVIDYPKIVDAIMSNTEMTPPMSFSAWLGYARLAMGLPSRRLIQVKLDNVYNAPDGSSDMIASQGTIDKAVNQFLNPDLTADTRAATQNHVAGRSAQKAAAPPPPGKTAVLVLNGGNTEGLAHDTSVGLAERGYKVVYPAGGVAANYPGTPLWHTIVYYDPAKARAKAAANELSKLFDMADVNPIVPKVAAMANGAMVVVAIGQTFDGTLPPIQQKVEVPAPQRPAITVNPGLTSGALNGLQPSVHFRLEVPSRVASSSYLSSESPIRLYRIFQKQKAVRITFKISGYNAAYWGIEETAWADAPILAETQFTKTIGGRRYDFYYQDAHLHMVVLHQYGATYWVVNTLDNLLSNETMKAIALGLRPTKGRVPR